MKRNPFHYEVIVIGGGHAGTEAALASARIGASTLLITHSIETLGQMSCNPAIGGIGKGHLVKEIDALGGIMGLAADAAGIQFRTLNLSKGAAVQATRAQADRQLYRAFIRTALQNQTNLWLFQDAVDDIQLQGNEIRAVITQSGLNFKASSIVLTAGTFLAGKVHIGQQSHAAGRAGDAPALSLAQRLREIFAHTQRLKTGTPPRIDRRSVDFNKLQQQWGDEPRPCFSYLSHPEHHPRQICCYITHTNQQTHELIRKNLHDSPLFNGAIEGIGPRYCPSIEDKVVRFADKQHHQIFVEPEGLSSHELYLNGISTSLPFSLQQQIVNSMHGFEEAHIVRPGYAIEYDFFDPTQLQRSLETNTIHGLFFAGQINGTTGYEEAAAQGLIAGTNAARRVKQLDPLILQRSQAYIGVLIDDLITQGTQEPYRMFTSRAEYRLSLREDNADQRLTAIGWEYGLVSQQRWQIFQIKQRWIDDLLKLSNACKLSQLIDTFNTATTTIPESSSASKDDADSSLINDIQHRLGKLTNHPGLKLAEIFRRADWQQHHWQGIIECLQPECQSQLQQQLQPITEYANLLSQSVYTQAIIRSYVELKYAGYLERQHAEIQRQKQRENQSIPAHFDYSRLAGLSTEVMSKLQQHRPETIGQASRISGVTPAAISILLVALKQRSALNQ